MEDKQLLTPPPLSIPITVTMAIVEMEMIRVELRLTLCFCQLIQFHGFPILKYKIGVRGIDDRQSNEEVSI